MLISNKMSVEDFIKARDAYCNFYRNDYECNCPYCIYDCDLDDALDILAKFMTDTAVTYKQLLETVFPAINRRIMTHKDITPSDLFDTNSKDWEDIVEIQAIYSIQDDIDKLLTTNRKSINWIDFLNAECCNDIRNKLNDLFKTDIF